MPKKYSRLRLILGDQLNPSHSWYRQKDDNTLYVIAELHQEASYVCHHVQKLCAFFAAMEQFADTLRSAGHQMLHLSLDDTAAFSNLPELLTHLLEKHLATQFQYQLPDEYRLREQLAEFCQSAEMKAVGTMVCDTEHFYLSDAELHRTFSRGKRHRLEAFYRKMRVRFHILMDGEEPEGGRWNYDAQNRNKLKADDLKLVPEPLLFANDVRDILARIKRHGIHTIGKEAPHLIWPINTQQASELLDYFCHHGIEHFGRFQDAMTGKLGPTDIKKQWGLFHSRLSFALNSKMLSPQHVINTVIEHYHTRQPRMDLAQVEGFVRQILGWREFIRGIYWANMPEYGSCNGLAATRRLPSWFWTGETRMHCLRQAITQSLEVAYAHHIQRLMITGNFCLLAGIDPDQVDSWYLGIYIDAIQWVELPNTRGMSQFADNGIVGSKAYAASGNYVKKMSDYCSDCHYRVAEATTPDACPLNGLYWRFMHDNQVAFAPNPRNKMVYAVWNKKSEDQRQAILEQATTFLADIERL
ncbi:cryptochrome/photolyase family protein [Desulfoluna spongiiphila]|uniref:Deoxyribodipyrimidine photolyase-related protein n=1 Tax=Desulfoluna spongiiphila TaxID=419481 RepID=A0A1G5D7Z3_9BACT|nr:cryptochrome/photolyase family protein [Desulfoluna spongiiphila]SCY10746.1 deoxyribodipyrimidine photolyase-related protein [Desulfoluna spongiiphila]